MSWSNYQLRRLQHEKEILAKYFSGRVQWLKVCGRPKVQVRLTSNSNRNYTLGVLLSDDFPHSCPRLLVESPSFLPQRNGTALPHNSQEFHTLADPSGFVSVCHFTPQFWTNENTLYQVFMKGRLWIEGYEGHLSTGRNMDFYLGHQNTF
jgi:hypothetical protein